MEIELRHAAKAAPRAKTIKLADGIRNLSDFAKKEPNFAATYLAEKEAQVDVLNQKHLALFERTHRAIAEPSLRLQGERQLNQK